MTNNKSFLAAAICASLATSTLAQEVLTGDKASACGAILCLVGSTRPSECTPPLRRYFSINARYWVDTIAQRGNFLNLCPTVSTDPKMQSLIPAIVNGAGRCDAQSLNQSTVTNYSNDGNGNQHFYIPSTMPAYCVNYVQHAYADLKTSAPRYVGTESRNGYWVDPAQYAQAVKDYAIHIAAQDAAAASTN